MKELYLPILTAALFIGLIFSGCANVEDPTSSMTTQSSEETVSSDYAFTHSDSSDISTGTYSSHTTIISDNEESSIDSSSGQEMTGSTESVHAVIKPTISKTESNSSAPQDDVSASSNNSSLEKDNYLAVTDPEENTDSETSSAESESKSPTWDSDGDGYYDVIIH